MLMHFAFMKYNTSAAEFIPFAVICFAPSSGGWEATMRSFVFTHTETQFSVRIGSKEGKQANAPT